MKVGIKDALKRKRRLVCQFSSGLDDSSATMNAASSSVATSVNAITARENKFWKARLESITNEYKKWRELSRKQIKATISSDGMTLPILAAKSSPIPISDKNSTGKINSESIKSSSYQSEKSALINQLGAMNDDLVFTSATSATTSTTFVASSAILNTASSSSIVNSTPVLSNGSTHSPIPLSSNSNLIFGNNQSYVTNISHEILNNDLAIQNNSSTTSDNFPNYQTTVPSLNNYGLNAYSSINATSHNYSLGK